MAQIIVDRDLAGRTYAEKAVSHTVLGNYRSFDQRNMFG